MNQVNKKWRFDAKSSVARNINGYEEIGYLYVSLNSNHFEEWEKHKAIELFVKKENIVSFAEQIEGYIKWVENTDLNISRDDIINTFEKYMEEPTVKCIDDYLKSDTYNRYLQFGF